MTTFLQLHILTSYPPANLNRDDSGQPKTAMMGGALRARVSSQSLKRAWRTSDVFATPLAGHVGKRTKRFTEDLMKRLIAAGQDEKKARDAATKVAGTIATVDKDAEPFTGQLVHLAPSEMAAIDALAERMVAGEAVEPTKGMLLGGAEQAADIAMFGRMLADNPDHSVEAAVQVAHALTTHRATVEDDYFTAVDDLKPRGKEAEDAGAGHVGEQEFVAGLFYLYVCIDRDLLLRNLGGDEALARAALRAFVEAAVKVGPKGKQASFASRAYASYVLAERGAQQPRGLSVAFLKPVGTRDERGETPDILTQSKQRIEETCQRFDAVYGACADERLTVDVAAGTGTLAGLLDFVAA